MYRTPLVVVCILLSVLVEERPVSAAEQGRPAAAREGEELNEQDKERVVTAATFLLALIAFAGLVLLALVMFWGYRTRRIARTPLPRTTQPDPFWYLRADKQAPPQDEEQRSP